jgi:hypothetical protein
LGVFGEDGVEALHVTDSAARRLVRQIKNPEARRKGPPQGAHPSPHRAYVYPAAEAGRIAGRSGFELRCRLPRLPRLLTLTRNY